MKNWSTLVLEQNSLLIKHTKMMAIQDLCKEIIPECQTHKFEVNAKSNICTACGDNFVILISPGISCIGRFIFIYW